MQLFLEVPDKCRIVSMQPFVRNRRRDLQRGGAHSILQQGKARKFGPDCVSWMPKGGTYYGTSVERFGPVETVLILEWFAVGHIDRTKLQRDLKGVITGTKVKDTGKEEVSTSRDTSMEVLAEDSAVLSSPDSLGGTPPAQLTVPDSQEDKLQAGAQEKVVLVDNMYVQL